MKNIITLKDCYNPHKEVQFKESKCYHYYQRQLIMGNPIGRWERVRKADLLDTIGRFYKGTIKFK